MIDFSAFADELIKIAEFHKEAGIGSALLGAGIGGVTGAATAPEGQPRWKSALMGAGLGAGAGLVGGKIIGSAGKAATKMKVNVAPTQVETGRRFFGMLPSKTKTVSKMTIPEAQQAGAALNLSGAQKAALQEQGIKALKGAGVATVGAAGAGLMGSRGIPYLQGTNQPQGGYYR